MNIWHLLGVAISLPSLALIAVGLKRWLDKPRDDEYPCKICGLSGDVSHANCQLCGRDGYVQPEHDPFRHRGIEMMARGGRLSHVRVTESPREIE